jgi:hypothetical protein
MKKKGYLTILLLFIGIYAIARTKKPKSRTIIDNTIISKPYAKINATAYQEDLITPIYTFRNEVLLGILDSNEQTNYSKVQFQANGSLKIGYIENNDIIIK